MRICKKNDHPFVLLSVLAFLLPSLLTTGCTSRTEALAQTYVEVNLEAEPIANTYGDLSVPTYVNFIDDTYFIVDCYHDQIIYHQNIEAPIWQWQVMPGELSRPHTIASDGDVYLVDDTENHRVLVYEKYNDLFVQTQQFDNIGNRPHFIYYHGPTKTFYVWSSMTGEMYLFRRSTAKREDFHPVELVDIRNIPQLDGVYVRSFTIMDEEIYFVSGNKSILRARLSDFTILEEYPVPDELAGMIQVMKLGSMYYITVSTDALGNQDYATILRTKDLRNLATGDYEDIYSLFVGGGTPYYLSAIGDDYYLTEHRIPGHSVWRFRVEEDNLVDIVDIW